MSVTHEADPGCSALGHLYRREGQARVCITCGHSEEVPAAPAAEEAADKD